MGPDGGEHTRLAPAARTSTPLEERPPPTARVKAEALPLEIVPSSSMPRPGVPPSIMQSARGVGAGEGVCHRQGVWLAIVGLLNRGSHRKPFQVGSHLAGVGRCSHDRAPG